MDKLRAILGASILLLSGQVGAATLNIVGGQLLGASNVDVGGTFYDVEFRDDGTCISFYSGCDELTDLPFNTLAGAVVASLALEDQVFIDSALGNFDSEPTLTNGCGYATYCGIFTHFGFDDSTGRVLNFIFSNNDIEAHDHVYLTGPNPTDLSFLPPSINMAVWSTTAVPIPAAIWLFGSALLGFFGLSRHSTIIRRQEGDG